MATLPDPAIAELTQHLEPVSDVTIHRQTGNRRNRYGQSRAWPAGLLAIGDAYCAFNPVYGQGITVAACQAVLIRNALQRDRTASRIAGRCRPGGCNAGSVRPLTCHGRLRHRRIGAIESSSGSPSWSQRLVGRWTGHLAQLAAHGDRAAYLAFARVYHLMASPAMLYHPAVIASACRAAVRGMPDASSPSSRAERADGRPYATERSSPRLARLGNAHPGGRR